MEKRRFIFSLSIWLATCLLAFADYTNIPWSTNANGRFTYDGYTFSTKTGYYQEWDHYVIFWSTDYNSQTNASTITSIGSGNYLLNLAEMKTYAERCYDVYVNQLGFYPPGSNNKIIILAYYSTDWFATGTGEGNYGILNIAHSSVNGDYYTYCHEIAHAYQYLGNLKYGGNAGFQYGDYYGYVSYYECSANWQASQIYQAKHFPQSIGIYARNTNLGFIHQWHCYQSYMMNDYWTEKREGTTIGQIWTKNTGVKYADPVEKYMAIYDLTAEEVYREFFWAAMRFVTWDLDRFDDYLSAEGASRESYMFHTPGTQACSNSATSTPTTYSDNSFKTKSHYQYVTTNSSSAIHQVAYSSAPQSTGYNIIKLNTPTGSNRTITTKFTALSPGASLASGDKKEYWTGNQWATISTSTYNTSQTSECNSSYSTYKNWRGFRLGYVTYKKSTGERKYNYADQVFCTGTGESSVNFQFDVPSDVDSLYLVVSPALSNYLRMGSVDPYNIESDTQFSNTQKMFDQWPYTVQFYNTNIYGLSVTPSAYTGSDVVTGTTYTSSTLPDLSGIVETKTYTISVASGSPAGAGFNVSSELTSIGNSQYETTKTITENNASNYIFPVAVDGYKAVITVNGTNITINYEELGPSMTVNRNLSLPVDAENYSYATFSFTSTELSNIASFLGISSTNFKNSSYWETWDDDGPSSGKLMLYAVDPTDGITLEQRGTTAEEPGHWFNTSCKVINYGDGNECLYSNYQITSGSSLVGQFPGVLSQGDTYTIRQAIVYNKNGTNYTIYLVFNVTMAASTSTASQNYCYTVNVVNDPGNGGITPKNGLTQNTSFNNYECSTELTNSNISSFATAISISGYSATLAVSGSMITVTYTVAAPVTYSVTYSGRTTSQGAGFSVVNGSGATKINNTSVTISGTVTTETIGNYITATEVDGYDASISVSGTTITITYTPYTVYTYTIQVASGAPSGAGFTTTNGLTGSDNTYSITRTELTNSNVSNYVIPNAVSGYTTTIAVSGSTVTITYTISESIGTGNFTPTRVTKVEEFTVKTVAGGTTELTVSNSSTLYENLAKNTITASTFQSGFSGYSTSTSSNKYYYYAISGVPTTSVFNYYQTASVTTDNDFSGKYTHYYYSNGQIASSANADNAAFKVAFDPTSLKFHVKANENCPAGYHTLYFGILGKGTRNNYVTYFTINIVVYPSITLADTDLQATYESNWSTHHPGEGDNYSTWHPDPDTTQPYLYNVTLTRSLNTGGWLSFCAPFNITQEEWEMMGIEEAKELVGIVRDGYNITLQFGDISDGGDTDGMIREWKPCIIKMKENKTSITKLSDYDMFKTPATLEVTSADNTLKAQMIGTFTKIDLPDDIYYIQSNAFRHTVYTGSARTAMKGWRGYFTITDITGEIKSIGYSIEENGEITYIQDAELVLNDIVNVYTLSGVCIKKGVFRQEATEGLVPGVYLIGGKKIIIK